jgi:predicted ferric reductase
VEDTPQLCPNSYLLLGWLKDPDAYPREAGTSAHKDPMSVADGMRWPLFRRGSTAQYLPWYGNPLGTGEAGDIPHTAPTMKEKEQGNTPEMAAKVRLKYTLGAGMKWLFAYALLAALLLIIAWVGHAGAHRGVLIEWATALGVLGLSMLALQSLFTGRFRGVAPAFGMDNILQFHREIGLVATVVVLAHPVLSIIGDAQYLEFFDPRVNFMRAVALIFATLAILLLAATSLWREAFKLNYEKWRLLHGLLGLAILFIGVVHALQVSNYFDPLWKKVALIAFVGGCMYLVLHTRLVRPYRGKALPYRVQQVKEERGDAWTLVLAPEQGERMSFVPGQFVWITLGPTPYSLQQHPFTIASSTREPTLAITAKALGDFTRSWASVKPGTTAFLEGPFGSFTPVRGYDLFLIMGGIGITPAMSMLRTLCEEGDGRRAILLYANSEPKDITFQDELDRLAKKMDLQVVHVLEELPKDWPGVEGRVDKKLIARYLPAEPTRCTYYICGPNALMDAAEEALRELGVPWDHIYTERFEIV